MPASRARNGLGATVDPKLAEDDRHVVPNRLLANIKSSRDVVVVQAFGENSQHFPLTLRQFLKRTNGLNSPLHRQEAV